MTRVIFEYNLQDDRWTEKAVKSLIKKIKKTSILEQLEKAIISQDSNSQCVSIPR